MRVSGGGRRAESLGSNFVISRKPRKTVTAVSRQFGVTARHIRCIRDPAPSNWVTRKREFQLITPGGEFDLTRRHHWKSDARGVRAARTLSPSFSILLFARSLARSPFMQAARVLLSWSRSIFDAAARVNAPYISISCAPVLDTA